MREDGLPEIPKEWRWTKVSDVIKKCSLTGKKVKQRQVKKEGKYPVIDQGQEFISGYVDDENLVIECEPPIIVFGDHTKIIKYVNFKFVAGADGVKAFKPLSIYHPKAFYYFLKAIKLPDKGYARHFQFLEKSPIPILPLPEQQKIVEILEDVFSKINAGVEGLKKIKKLLSIYRKAVLKYAFEGKLTERWREENKDKLESVEELIEKIRKERKERYKQELEEWKKACEIAKKEGKKKPPKPKKPKELPPITEEELQNLPEIPEEWTWIRLGEIVSLLKDKVNPIKIKREPYIGLEHIEKGTGKLLGYGYSDELKSTKAKFYKGNLLYGRLRPYLNKVYLADFDGLCSTDILVLDVNNNVYNKFLLYRLLHTGFVKYATQRMSGVQHPRVDFIKISQFIISLPSFFEQQRIVEEIEYRLSLADKLEETIDKVLKKAEKLKQSYLKYAFEGKLTEEWRKQNPHLVSGENSVERLLEKIKAEKEKSKEKKKKIKVKQKSLKELK